MQRGFFSIFLAIVAIMLGVSAAMHADKPAVRWTLIAAVSALALVVVVWLLAWCLPSMFGEWRKLAVPPGSCPNCGYDVRPAEELCPECGHRLTLFSALRREEDATAGAEGEGGTEQPTTAAEAGAKAEASATAEAATSKR